MKQNQLPNFRDIIQIQGLKIGLRSMAQVSEYLDYRNARLFTNRLNKCLFNMVELRQMFERLHFSNEDILNFFGRST